jgi:thiol-disulfide isomerase/thioredoxin
MTGRTKLAVSAAIVLIAAIGYAFLGNTGMQVQSDQKAQDSSTAEPKKIEAPDFTMKNLAGKDVKLSDYRGKIVFINFWATWCGPCRHEVPIFVDLQKEYGDDLVILGISLDQGDLSVVPKFAKEYNINYEVLYGTRQVVDAYGGVQGIPTTFVVDRDGYVRDGRVGFPGKEYFDNMIKQLM